MYNLAHIGLQVSNTEKSLKFYTEALGGEKVFEYDMPSGAHLTFVKFGDFLIELIYKERNDRVAGINHFAIEVPDIHAAVKRIVQAGFPAKEENIAPMGDHAKNIFISGPDGESIELCEGSLM